jgi:hypothetical protein
MLVLSKQPNSFIQNKNTKFMPERILRFNLVRKYIMEDERPFEEKIGKDWARFLPWYDPDDYPEFDEAEAVSPNPPNNVLGEFVVK